MSNGLVNEKIKVVTRLDDALALAIKNLSDLYADGKFLRYEVINLTACVNIGNKDDKFNITTSTPHYKAGIRDDVNKTPCFIDVEDNEIIKGRLGCGYFKITHTFEYKDIVFTIDVYVSKYALNKKLLKDVRETAVKVIKDNVNSSYKTLLKPQTIEIPEYKKRVSKYVK